MSPVVPGSAAVPGSAGTSEPPAGTSAPSPSDGPAIDPGEGRLVWLVDRAGGLGVWTTDLAGGDLRPYLAGFNDAGTAIRDAHRIEDDVALLRDVPAPAGAELWLVSRTAPPRLLLDEVDTFTVRDDREILAVRDEGTTRSIWRVPTGAPATSIASLALPDGGPELGPFGVAISPDGRTVALGWVGGRIEVIGPAPASYDDMGAPLVVADDGQLIAVTGRAGEAYLVDGDRLIDLAPADSDPVALPGTGTVAWPTVADDGSLVGVEVRDLLAGTGETYPAQGLTTNVRELTPSQVILEATAFDPLTRTVTVIDRGSGRWATFEAQAPQAD